MTRFNFTWIDDTPERAENFRGALAGNLRNEPTEVQLEVIGLKDGFVDELNACVEQWLTSPPDLIMIDHSFTKVQKRMFGIHGSALAHLLRVQLPGTPMVCVSAQNLNSADFSAEDISEYTYLFDVNRLNNEDSLEILFAIAQDFATFRFPEKEPVRHLLVDALLPPEGDKSALLNVLPEEFEGTFVHSTSPHRMARWVLNVLMSRPGFLVDTLEAATMLGLTEEGFARKVKQYFGPARYSGPFATETRPLWWASALPDALYEVVPDHVTLVPTEAGRRLPGIEESDYSRCAVTGEHSPPPDVVAFTDATASERRAVRYSYTEPLSEEASSQLGFSTRLKIKNPRRRS
jgi:hypothetical protein